MPILDLFFSLDEDIEIPPLSCDGCRFRLDAETNRDPTYWVGRCNLLERDGVPSHSPACSYSDWFYAARAEYHAQSPLEHKS